MQPGADMLGTVHSCALVGIDAFPVVVEVDAASGLPAYHVVGLPATSIKEGAVRIRSALENVGQGLPNKKITVNLAPADRRKGGAAFDLPIAVGVLVADGVAELGPLRDMMLLGELGLDGSLRPVPGALAAGLLAREMNLRGIVLPTESAAEAAEVDGLDVFAASHLREVVAALFGEGELVKWSRAAPRSSSAEGAGGSRSLGDMSDVRGQRAARAALEVAVAGAHNALLVGPPGIGKTMLARRIPTILPPLTRDEALETTKIYSSVAMARGGLVAQRPFRAPHHSISAPALLGGGSPPRPGEISLSHNGVLFLDELPEFSRVALESLRQPLEDRTVTIGRVRGSFTLPASFLLVASANPCPCGWLGARDRVCTCGFGALERYRAKLSGPLLDRIDLQLFVPNVGLEEMRSAEPGESSASIRERVVRARERQAQRLAPFGHRTNAEMSARAVRATCPLSAGAEKALARLHRVRPGMTGRTVERIIKVARTIADLGEGDEIDAGCILEAASYRALDAPAADPRRFSSPAAGSGAARSSSTTRSASASTPTS